MRQNSKSWVEIVFIRLHLKLKGFDTKQFAFVWVPRGYDISVPKKIQKDATQIMESGNGNDRVRPLAAMDAMRLALKAFVQNMRCYDLGWKVKVKIELASKSESDPGNQG